MNEPRNRKFVFADKLYGYELYINNTYAAAIEDLELESMLENFISSWVAGFLYRFNILGL